MSVYINEPISSILEQNNGHEQNDHLNGKYKIIREGRKLQAVMLLNNSKIT